MKHSDAERVIGKEIVSQDGRTVGRLVGLDVDMDDWRVRALVVKLHRDHLRQLHVKRPLVGTRQVRISTRHVGGVGDVIVLSRRGDELASLIEREPEGLPAGEERASEEPSLPEGVAPT